jgi:transposase
MIWAAVMRGIKGPLIVLKYPGGKGGGMNTDRYISQVLEPHLAPFYHHMEKQRLEIVFQQDGTPSHTAKATKKWLSKHSIDLFPHPSNSPNLNPIEPLWHNLKNIVRGTKHLPTTVPKLIKAVRDAWEILPISDIDKHINTMPDRVQAVLVAKGGHTHF